ncbi:SWIM zinc finger family protein [Deinococcus sp. PESE-13]
MAALSEQAARRWVGPREWQKGQPYLRRLDDLSQRQAARGTEYRAVAQGQRRYRVSATVREGRVLDASCTCPVGSGACKHVAALLAQVAQDAAAFDAEQDLGSVLGALERPALERLVFRLLERAPELEGLVYAQAGLTSAGRLASRIEAAFADLTENLSLDDLLYLEEDASSEELDLLLDELGTLLEELDEGDEEQAAALAQGYLALLDGVQAFYERLDIDFGLDGVAQEALAGLYSLFTHAELEGDVREEALEAVRLEMTSGRVAYDEEFRGWVLVLRPDEQREVRQLLESLSRGSGPRQHAALRGLLDLRGGPRSDADEEALLRAAYSPSRLGLFLAQRGRTGEAVQTLQTVRGPLPFAELRGPFERAGALAELEQLALSRTGGGSDEARLWLHQLYLGSGRREQAHALAWQELVSSNRAEWLAALKLGSTDWPADRETLITRLRGQRGAQQRLLDLLLAEGLADQAFELVSDAGDTLAPALALQVAALPGLSDERAALLSVQVAQRLAAGRHRRAYAEAATALRPLLGRLGQRETRQLVAAAFPESSRLPALRDELRKAGLL